MLKKVSTWVTAILLVAAVAGGAEKTDSEKRLDEIRARRLQVIEEYGRARAMAEALGKMSAAEKEMQKLEAEEGQILKEQTRELEKKNPEPRNKPNPMPYPEPER